MDSEDDLFITQSIFQDSSATENPALLDLSVASTTAARCEDLIDSNCIDELFGERSTTGVYQPECSDISDNELVASCEAIEKNRFGQTPLSETEIASKSSKRQVKISNGFDICILLYM